MRGLFYVGALLLLLIAEVISHSLIIVPQNITKRLKKGDCETKLNRCESHLELLKRSIENTKQRIKKLGAENNNLDNKINRLNKEIKERQYEWDNPGKSIRVPELVSCAWPGGEATMVETLMFSSECADQLKDCQKRTVRQRVTKRELDEDETAERGAVNKLRQRVRKLQQQLDQLVEKINRRNNST